jgi:hypothetical protein
MSYDDDKNGDSQLLNSDSVVSNTQLLAHRLPHSYRREALRLAYGDCFSPGENDPNVAAIVNNQLVVQAWCSYCMTLQKKHPAGQGGIINTSQLA